MRYINQMPADQTFTDHLGNVNIIDPRNDVQFHRVKIDFRGWLGSPNLRSSPAQYFAVYDMYTPLWKALTSEASQKVRLGNYERLFDEGRRRVRAWEKT